MSVQMHKINNGTPVLMLLERADDGDIHLYVDFGTIERDGKERRDRVFIAYFSSNGVFCPVYITYEEREKVKEYIALEDGYMKVIL